MCAVSVFLCSKTCEIEYWFPCGLDGRAVYGHVTTKFSGMGRFTYPWCFAGALRARSSFKKDIGSHFLNGLNFNIKWRETSKAIHPTIFWKRRWKKVLMIAWQTSLLNGHTLATHRERSAITFCKGKNPSKGSNFDKKWRKTTKGTHRRIFWGRWWKSTVR